MSKMGEFQQLQEIEGLEILLYLQICMAAEETICVYSTLKMELTMVEKN